MSISQKVLTINAALNLITSVFLKSPENVDLICSSPSPMEMSLLIMKRCNKRVLKIVLEGRDLGLYS